MDYLAKVIEEIETHNAEGIAYCFRNGVDPNTLFRGEPLLHELISEYGRGPAFQECVEVFVEHGLEYHQPALLAVLLDDGPGLSKQILKSPTLISDRFTVRCAFTPLYHATLLHFCAEFNHVEAARVLLDAGADVNAVAGVDDEGFGGQTPIFHTVNQNRNRSQEMMELLLERGADLSFSVQGIVWGDGYPWETLIPSVNAISYAMMGHLPQMHREESTVARTVQRLMLHQYGVRYELKNVPNRYLSNG